MNGIVTAIVDTIHAGYAATIVDLVILGIDAGRFASARTERASRAFVRVNGYLKQ